MKNIILFFFWPMGYILNNILRPNKKFLKYAALLLTVMFSFNVTELGVSDFQKYILNAPYALKMSFNQILLEKDYYYLLYSKLLTAISEDFHFISFGYISVFFLLLYQNWLLIFCQKIGFNQNILLNNYAIIAVFTAYPFMAYINIRFSSALLIYSWFLLNRVFKDDRRYYFGLLLPPLFHFSFYAMLLLPLIYEILKKLKIGLFFSIILFILTMLYSSPDIAHRINDISSENFRSSISNQLSSYASEDGLERSEYRLQNEFEQGNLNRKINRTINEIANFVPIFAILLIVILKFKQIISHAHIRNIFILLFSLYSLINMISTIAYAERFYSLSSLITVYLYSYVLLSIDLKFNTRIVEYIKIRSLSYLIFGLTVVSFFNSMYAGRVGYNLLNIVFGNIFTAIFNLIV